MRIINQWKLGQWWGISWHFLGVLGLIWAILVSNLFVSSVSALTFSPQLNVNFSNFALGGSSQIIIGISQGPTDEAFKQVVFTIPAGFDINSLADVAASLPANFPLEVGAGTLCIPGSGCSPFQVLNVADTAGHKAIWRLFGGGNLALIMDIIIDGDVTTGHTITFKWPASFLSSLATPLSLNFIISSQITNIFPAVNLVTQPSVTGDYTFQAQYTSISNLVLTRSIIFNVPGSTTATGSNVTSSFSTSSVQFSNVTSSGITSLSTSTTPPPSGTGQFQLSGGLYYDFDTTAQFSCPCTITIPFPQGTNNPRIYHLANGVWTDVTTSVNRGQRTVTGVVSSFSFFAVAEPNFSVNWDKPIKKFLAKKGDPFPIENDEDLGIKFSLLDSDSQLATPANVAVEIWQTKDSLGVAITPTKVLILTPEINEHHQRFQTKLDLKTTPLALGTYEVRVLVSNTTATQTPQTASFTVVED